MSNPLAIAAVTRALQTLLENEIKGSPLFKNLTPATNLVTVMPPDKARPNNNDSKLNLFLYQVNPSAHWRNNPPQGAPPLGLNLYYLLTSYGVGDDEIFGHHLLGLAMRILHDHPILKRDRFSFTDATYSQLDDSDLSEQIEHVRVSHQALSLEEISKIWSAFQSNYRLSVAYEASLVLINSERPNRVAPPLIAPSIDTRASSVVLRGLKLLRPRGATDDLLEPRITPSVRAGDTLLLEASGLASQIQLSLSGGRLEELTAQRERTINTSQITLHRLGYTFVVPDDLPVGRYTLTITLGEKVPRVEKRSLVICPVWELDTSVSPNPVYDAATKTLTLSIKSAPAVWPSQSVVFLLNSRSLPVTPPSKTTQLSVAANPVNAGETFWVRLRVDGIDSWLIDLTSDLPSFDERLQVEATP